MHVHVAVVTFFGASTQTKGGASSPNNVVFFFGVENYEATNDRDSNAKVPSVLKC
jgi:hypothetical protein